MEKGLARKPGSMFYPNMNILRYLLSLGILINHFNLLMNEDVSYFIPYDRIGGFFALSGFLMYHSYMKVQDVPTFIKHRARRLLPTYLFIILLCAFGGVFLTHLSPSDYFGNSGFWKYLAANISFLNWLAPSLPGVFEGPEFTNASVNGSLWTMKVECALDLSVPLFVWILAKTKWRKEVFAFSIVMVSILLRVVMWKLFDSTGRQIFEILSRQAFTQMGFFYAGMLMYFYRDLAEKNLKLVIAAGLLLYTLSGIFPEARFVIGPFSVAMLFIGISMWRRTISTLIHVNCISYNIFLIHYPVIQVCVLLGLEDLSKWSALAITIAITVVLAYLTNRYIDRPFNRRKNK